MPVKEPIVAEAADKIGIKCKCGGKFRVPATARGKRIKCPKCASPLAIPMAAAARPAAPADDGLLDALAGHEEAASAAPISQSNACPNCVTPLAAGAIVCVNCGYNQNTGQLMGAVNAPAPAVSKSDAVKSIGSAGASAVAALSGGVGQMGIGIALSAAGAAIGGVIWFFVAIKTGYNIGWIAVFVGGLSGLGMRMGLQGHSTFGAIIAVVLGIGAIAGARYMILSMILQTNTQYGQTDNQIYADALVSSLTNESFASNGISIDAAIITPAGEDPKKYKDPTSGKIVNDMTEDDFADFDGYDNIVRSAYDEKSEDMHAKVNAMQPDEIKRQVAERPKAQASVDREFVLRDSRASYSFIRSFRFFDLIWFILAAGAAWKAAGSDE